MSRNNRLRLCCALPSHLKDSRWEGDAKPKPPGLSPRNLVCLRALVAVALSLTRTLDSSRFAALEAFQDADYSTFLPHAVVPHLVASRLSHYVIGQGPLQQGPRHLLNESDGEFAPTLSSLTKPDGKSAASGDKADSERKGSTAPARGVSRERFSCRWLIITNHSSSVLIPRKAGSALFYNIPQ